ncbi:MAG: DegT/DnrJ/EryC1/StrS family aminotransferase [Phycisphaerae bacterium]|nr:DegT/DnrJ/EryC1/StrS family aminotransferase [Phycisphaerae bacterium]
MNKFETQFTDYFSAQQAFAFWKARVGLYALLRAMNIGPDDEVVLPGYTCVMDVNPIKYVGAKPVYVDIEPVMFNMNVDLLEQAITTNTKLILAQHTYGYPCEMNAIFEIANKYNIPVVEDCCLALGSQYKNKLCGTFGKAAYFSFQWNKPFTTGLGGMVSINDKDLIEPMQDIYQQAATPGLKAQSMLKAQRMVYRTVIYPRTTAMITNLFRWMTKKGLVVGSSSCAEFMPEMAEDFLTKMGSMQVAAGTSQMNKINKNIAHRQQMAKLYDKLLSEADFDIPTIPDYMDPVLVRYPLRVSDKEKALAGAPAAGVEIGSWFECPLHPIETPMHLYDYTKGQCPEAEKACRETINLPLHPRAGEKTVRRTVAYIKQFR